LTTVDGYMSAEVPVPAGAAPAGTGTP